MNHAFLLCIDSMVDRCQVNWRDISMSRIEGPSLTPATCRMPVLDITTISISCKDYAASGGEYRACLRIQVRPGKRCAPAGTDGEPHHLFALRKRPYRPHTRRRAWPAPNAPFNITTTRAAANRRRVAYLVDFMGI